MADVIKLLPGILIVSVFVFIAVGIVFLLRTFAPNMPWKKRGFVAGLIAGFLPMPVPIAVFLIRSFTLESLLAGAIIGCYGFLVALIFGYPVAFIVSRKLARDALRRSTLDD